MLKIKKKAENYKKKQEKIPNLSLIINSQAPENFEKIWPRLDRLCQIWHIGRLGPMLFRALES